MGLASFEPRLAHVVETSCARLYQGSVELSCLVTFDSPCNCPGGSVAERLVDWHQGTQLRYAPKVLLAALVLHPVVVASLPCLCCPAMIFESLVHS